MISRKKRALALDLFYKGFRALTFVLEIDTLWSANFLLTEGRCIPATLLLEKSPTMRGWNNHEDRNQNMAENPNSPPEEKPKRSRASKPKVKTGCQTCKYVPLLSRQIFGSFLRLPAVPESFTGLKINRILGFEGSNAMKRSQVVSAAFDSDIAVMVTSRRPS